MLWTLVEEAGWTMHPSRQKGASLTCGARRSFKELHETVPVRLWLQEKHWRLTRGVRRSQSTYQVVSETGPLPNANDEASVPQWHFPRLRPQLAGVSFQATAAIGSFAAPSRVANGIPCSFRDFSVAKDAFHWVLHRCPEGHTCSSRPVIPVSSFELSCLHGVIYTSRGLSRCKKEDILDGSL
jgi:hypothetical protein